MGLTNSVETRLAGWQQMVLAERIWQKDPTVWFDPPRDEIANRLGWLDLPAEMVAELGELTAVAAAAGSFRHAVLCGMGGSSLAPEVFQQTFGNAPGHPELLVADSTHPDAVAALADRIDPAATVFVVSSKSGTTLETMSLFRFFWKQVAAVSATPGEHFIAISDPGSSLAALAEERGFRASFSANPDVGGRYSALSHFGLVPAALIGADVEPLLASAAAMAASCGPAAPGNPALALGAWLGEAARGGRDKATYLTSSALDAYPAWVEQLIAESTGKNERGILPVAGEAIGSPEQYGDDRVFVYLRYTGDDDAVQAEAVDRLEAAGHPVQRFEIPRLEDLGGVMFRAELAVAASGVVLAINPFDQPDVELAKVLAREAMSGEAATEPVPAQAPADPLDSWEAHINPGDYVAIQAFLPFTPEGAAALERLRLGLRDRHRVATTVGWGPRFLHSTGQLHKGGPNSGVFLQIVDTPSADIEVPEADFSFGKVIRAQADGDFRALQQRDRRVVRVDLGSHRRAGLAALTGGAGG